MTMTGSTVSYVAGTEEKGGIQIYSDDVIITDSTIEYCQKMGIYCEADPILLENVVRYNEYGIYFKNSQENITEIESNTGENQFDSSPILDFV